jgi:glycosyltransferase involved in cell wall biosynthesis
MKISIITVCLNSAKTIPATLNSVQSQDYKNIEHIIIDGESKDDTIKIVNNYSFPNKKIIIGKDKNLYDAINKGIKNSTGDIIAILNSDDIYHNTSVIGDIIKEIKKNKKKDIFLTDVVFFSGKRFQKIRRYYQASNFRRDMFKYGMMPPHPGAFIRKKVYIDHGLYDVNYKIASDFDALSRFIYLNKVKFKNINKISVRMRTGGISGENLKAYIISSLEIAKSLKKNNIRSNIFKVLLRIPSKINQFFYYSSDKLNKNFELKVCKNFNYYFKNRFKIIKNIKSINFNKSFVLSAMNLAFLGYYSANKINNFRTLINWPDGLFSKLYGHKIKKIPGREIIRKIIIPKNIKEILILGNLSDKSLFYLKKRFKIVINKFSLPYGSSEKIKKSINFKIKKNQLIFITLPTPKQEILAEYISSMNKKHKIICIGASINIASGEEREVPTLIKNFEFLWRLRYETYRRLVRLVETFLHYINGRFIKRNIQEIEFENI